MNDQFIKTQNERSVQNLKNCGAALTGALETFLESSQFVVDRINSGFKEMRQNYMDKKLDENNYFTHLQNWNIWLSEHEDILKYFPTLDVELIKKEIFGGITV